MCFYYIQHAIKFKKQVKGWSRKKKEALFKEYWNKIVKGNIGLRGLRQAQTDRPLKIY